MTNASRAALAAACALALASGALAQTTQPIQINDVAFGLNNSNPAATVQHVRGDASLTNAAFKVGSTWGASFVQAIQFDNLDGFRHAWDGNLIGLDFGALASGGGNLYAMETRRTPGSTTPGAVQNFFNIRTYNTANQTSIVESRLSGLSVSPANNRIVVTGNDAGQTYVMDYAAGATPGTGAGASVSNVRELSNLVPGGSNTQGTAWLDNDNVLVLDNSGTLKKVTVGSTSLSSSDVGSVTMPFPGLSAFSSIAYEPTLSPYVYVMVGQFSTPTTANKLFVLDPNNNYASVGSFDYSTSIQTAREIAFDSKGNLLISEFGAGTTTPAGASIDVIHGGNILANLADNNSVQYYSQDQNSFTNASFTGVDVAAAILDYKTAGVTVDVKGKSSTVRYFPGTVENPQAEIRQRLLTGRNGGTWDGAGSAITSSLAAANAAHNTAIGYAQASELNLIGQEWGGVTVDGPAVVLKYTWYGDTDLNGVVNFDDYVRTDNGFNNHLTGWTNGDFDYNDVINFDDYVLIDLAFNTQNGTLGRALSFLDGSDRSLANMDDPALQKVAEHLDEFGNDYAQHFLAAVPEPASLALAGAIGSSMLIARRRRARGA